MKHWRLDFHHTSSVLRGIHIISQIRVLMSPPQIYQGLPQTPSPVKTTKFLPEPPSKNGRGGKPKCQSSSAKSRQAFTTKFPRTATQGLHYRVLKSVLKTTTSRALISLFRRLQSSTGNTVLVNLLKKSMFSWTLLVRFTNRSEDASTLKDQGQKLLKKLSSNLLKLLKTSTLHSKVLSAVIKLPAVWRLIVALSRVVISLRGQKLIPDVKCVMLLVAGLKKSLSPQRLFSSTFAPTELRLRIISLLKLPKTLTAQNITSKFLQCVVAVTVWAGVSLAIPALAHSTKLLKSHTTQRVLQFFLQKVISVLGYLNTAVMDRVCSSLHDLSPTTMSVLSLVLSLVVSTTLRVIKSPLTRQLVSIAVNDIVTPGILHVGRLTLQALTSATIRNLLPWSARKIISIVYPLLASTVMRILMSSTARRVLYQTAQKILTLTVNSTSPYLKNLVKTVVCSLTSCATSVVLSPAAKGMMYLKPTSFVQLWQVVESVAPYNLWTELLSSSYLSRYINSLPAVRDVLVPVMKSSTWVSQEMQSLRLHSFQAVHRSLQIIYSLCLLPQVVVLLGKHEDISHALKYLHLPSFQKMMQFETLVSCSWLLEVLLSPETRNNMSSALQDLIPPSVRGLLTSWMRGVYPLTDHTDQSHQPVFQFQAIHSLLYGVLEALMSPAVQRLLRGVLTPALQFVSSPRVQRLFLSSQRLHRLLPSSAVQKLISSSQEVKHIMLSSQRINSIIGQTQEIQSLIGTARECLAFYAKTIQN